VSGQSKWIWVSLPYATFGILVDGGKVIDAAPIANWMKGKDTHSIREWINKKNGTWKVLKGEE
jgi:hypothetical protein